MAGKRVDPSRDYYVVTKRHRRLSLWDWEICRRSKPLGVSLRGSDFESASAAKLAGEAALMELLQLIAQEQRENDPNKS